MPIYYCGKLLHYNLKILHLFHESFSQVLNSPFRQHCLHVWITLCCCSLVGEQWILWKQEGDEEVDLYYPVFMTVR